MLFHSFYLGLPLLAVFTVVFVGRGGAIGTIPITGFSTIPHWFEIPYQLGMSNYVSPLLSKVALQLTMLLKLQCFSVRFFLLVSLATDPHANIQGLELLTIYFILFDTLTTHDIFLVIKATVA